MNVSLYSPLVDKVVSNLFQLGPYHQAAANTRYTGAVIARLADNINKVNNIVSCSSIGLCPHTTTLPNYHHQHCLAVFMVLLGST